MHLAASENQIEVVLYLVAIGACVDENDRFGNTPLDDSIREGNLHVKEILTDLPSYAKRRESYCSLDSESLELQQTSSQTDLKARSVDNATRLQLQHGMMRSSSIRASASFSNLSGSARDLGQKIKLAPNLKLAAAAKLAPSDDNNQVANWLKALMPAAVSRISAQPEYPRLMQLVNTLNDNGLHHLGRMILNDHGQSNTDSIQSIGLLTKPKLEKLACQEPLIGKTLEGGRF